MLTEYNDLLTQLSALRTAITGLHQRRADMEQHALRLQARRRLLSSQILDDDDDDAPAEVRAKNGELYTALEQMEQEQRMGAAKYEALQSRCNEAEQELWELLPKAGPPFQRLRMAIYQRTLALEMDLTLARVPESRRGAVWLHAQEIALVSQGVEEVLTLVVPDTASYFSSRPLEDTEHRWERSDVAKACLETCGTLCESAEKLLAHVNGLGEQFQVPDFFLGEPPAAPSPGFEHVAEWLLPVEGTERDLAEKICKAGNKDINNLTPHDKLILEQTLKNYYVIHGRDVPAAPAAPAPATVAEATSNVQ